MISDGTGALASRQPFTASPRGKRADLQSEKISVRRGEDRMERRTDAAAGLPMLPSAPDHVCCCLVEGCRSLVWSPRVGSAAVAFRRRFVLQAADGERETPAAAAATTRGADQRGAANHSTSVRRASPTTSSSLALVGACSPTPRTPPSAHLLWRTAACDDICRPRASATNHRQPANTRSVDVDRQTDSCSLYELLSCRASGQLVDACANRIV
jgi:hypothetical protein